MKKDCRSKNIDKSKGFDHAPYIEGKTSLEGGDVCLTYICTYSNHDAWLINLGIFT
jgi:hypothetical protein